MVKGPDNGDCLECFDHNYGIFEKLQYSRCDALLYWYVLLRPKLFANSVRSHSDALGPPGLAESTFYPAVMYVIGSWYKGNELAKRACIFAASTVMFLSAKHMSLSGD